MTVSLHRQLMRRLSVPLLALLVLDAVGSYWLALHFSQRAYDAGLYDSARSLAQQVKIVAGRATVELPREALEIFEWDVLDRTYFAVNSGRSGLVLGHADFPAPPEPPERELEPHFYDASLGGEPIRAVAIRLPALDDRITVLVGETLAKRNSLTEEILVAMLLPQLILALVAMALLRVGIRGGLAPLEEVAEHIEQRSLRDLRPLAEAGPAEVRPLTRALNELLGALAAAQTSQRRFIANAAHQLRSPLAALQLQAERALRDSDPATHAQALEHVVTGAGRVAHIARQLLTLARAEPESSAEQRFSDVDLVMLAQDVTSNSVPEALARGVDLGYEGDEPGPGIRGDPALLRELVANLIDNALRYGRPKGRVTVSVSGGMGGGSRPQLIVEDDGPGIPGEWRDAVFDRFIRLPGSHGEGCGLGLAIVKEIALLHGGSAAIGTGEGGGGARVTVTFGPRRPEAPASRETGTRGRVAA
jgi:two-component system sensor histidine kinase TctE